MGYKGGISNEFEVGIGNKLGVVLSGLSRVKTEGESLSVLRSSHPYDQRILRGGRATFRILVSSNTRNDT